MKKSVSKGKLLSFEGIDGSGKTTQSRVLFSYLKETKNIPILWTKEPGDTSLGQVIRMISLYPKVTYNLFNKKLATNSDYVIVNPDEKRSLEAEIMLFMGARCEILSHLIRPKINAGINIIIDRFLDSTRAYQGGGQARGDQRVVDAINYIHKFIIGMYMPDKTFLLDLTAKEASKRIFYNRKNKDDIFENKKLNFMRAVRKEYLKIAEEEPNRVVVIDGTPSAVDIFNEKTLPLAHELFNLGSVTPEDRDYVLKH